MPPATTEGYAILAAPLALHSYSARPCDICSHFYILTDLPGHLLAPLPLICLLPDAPLHSDDADMCADACLLQAYTTLSSSSVQSLAKGYSIEADINPSMH